ncbi:MAG: RNA polymerase sigma factor [Burkholderiales bacterium]
MARASLSEFDDLLVQHLPRMRAYALALTRSTANADDLVQQASYCALRGRLQFIAGTNFKAWMHRIVRNVYLSSVRGANKPLVRIGELDESVLSRPADQEDKLFAKQLLGVMDRLTDLERDVLSRVTFGAATYQEIAQSLGCSVKTVKSRIFRARRRMQTIMLQGLHFSDRPLLLDG